MKLKLIDKEKKGFARYCPTFARVWGRIKERFRKKRLPEKAKEEVVESVPGLVMVRSEDEKTLHAVRKLADAARRGEDISTAIPALTDELLEYGWEGRREAVSALELAARNGTGISIAIPVLVNLICNHTLTSRGVWVFHHDDDLRDVAKRAILAAVENEDTRNSAISMLGDILSDKHLEFYPEEHRDARRETTSLFGEIVNRGIDVSSAVPALAAALQHDDPWVREAAADTLKKAAEKDMDISVALPHLVRLLLDDYPNARDNAMKSVWIVMERGDRETRNSIISYIDDFVKSGLFMAEAEKNSRGYVWAVRDLNALIRRIQELEEAA